MQKLAAFVECKLRHLPDQRAGILRQSAAIGMTPQLYEQVESIYHAALELQNDNLYAFLEQACAGNKELRLEVEQLLESNKQISIFMVEPAASALHLFAEEKAATLIGQQLGHYKILSAIGIGGMGEVYLAEDTILKRKAALKVLPVKFTRNPERLSRFKREARTASALNHPNILTIYEIGESDSVHFMATEFVEGSTLRQRLESGRLEMRDAVKITAQVAAALSAAHLAGITHRDIKPENIMVRPDGLVKVLDFGLATMVEQHQETIDSLAPTQAVFRTEPGIIMGTPRYMSPEQARAQKVDSRTDIFSLGAVLYEMIAGKPSFPGLTPAEVFAALLDKDPVPLSKIVPDTPELLEEIVAKALAKEPEDRYQTIEAFLHDLNQVRSLLKAARMHQTDFQPTLELKIPAATDTSLGAGKTRESVEVRKDTSLQLPTPTLETSDAKTAPKNRWRIKILLAATAFAVAAWLYKPTLLTDLAKWWRGSSTTFTATTLASEPGYKYSLAFSPDGNRIAYSWDGGKKSGNSDIYIRSLNSGEPIRLTVSPESDGNPAWSPDGNQIAFLRNSDDGKHEVFVVPVRGGNERKLGEASSGVSWSSDGKSLVISSVATASAPSSVFLLSVETGELRRLTAAATNPPSDDIRPVFSPDGKYVAFLRQFTDAVLDLYVVPVTGGVPLALTSDKRNISSLTWSADSREIIYSANRGDGRALWRIPVTGGVPQRMTVTGQNPYSPAASPKGNRLAYTNVYSDINIYQYEGAGFNGNVVPRRPFSEPRTILSSVREDGSQQFSPDGKWIVFTSHRNDREDIWLSDRDENNPIQLTDLKSPTGTPRWSPDGERIAFDSRNQLSADIYVVSAVGGTVRQLTNEAYADTMPSWSGDGRWIYFNSNRSGRGEIWKLPANGGQAVQVTRGGAFEGFESPDGKLFYFSKGRGIYGLWAVPVDGGEERPVPELNRAGYYRSWGVLPEGIYFISKETTPRQTVKFFSFATRRIAPLVTVEKEPLWWQPGLSLSPDGRRLLYAQLDHEIYEILLVENFR